TDEAVSRATEVNFGGALRTIREAARRFAAQRVGGDVVLVSTKNVAAPGAEFAEGSVRSGLWDGVGAERARARGLDPEQLPAFYRERNLLKVEVTGSHVGKAVVFLASGQV